VQRIESDLILLTMSPGKRLNRPFGSALQRKRFLEGLRLAGLPER
jgi:hypothetical protein